MTIAALRQAHKKAADELLSMAMAPADKYDATTYEAKEKEVNGLLDQIHRAEKAQQLIEAGASQVTVVDNTGIEVTGSIEVKSDPEVVKQAPLRMFVAKMIEAHTKGATTVDAFLKKAYGNDAANYQQYMKRSQQLSDYGSGGALSLPDFAEMIISGLNNVTVVRRMNPQVFAVPGALLLPREVSAPDGEWLNENEAPTPGTFEFGDIRLDPKRLPVEVVISRRLLDQAQRGGTAVANVEGYIVRRLRERMAVNEDYGFLRGLGTVKTPLGIRNQINKNNIFAATAGMTFDKITPDLRKLPLALTQSNIVITNGYWIMAPRTKSFLADLRNSNGFQIYPSIDETGNLLGYPILETNQIPINLSGTNTEIMFCNGPSVIVANSGDAQVTMSIEGSYQSGNQHMSLVQRNELLIHMETYSDVKLERDSAASVLTGVAY